MGFNSGFKGLNYRLSDQVQYSVMASRISNQAWSKCLEESKSTYPDSGYPEHQLSGKVWPFGYICI